MTDSGTYTVDVKNPSPFSGGFDTSNLLASKYEFIKTPESSEWQCYLFGNRPGSIGMIYTPPKGRVPNWFVRWAMRIFFDCLWVKNKSEKKV